MCPPQSNAATREEAQLGRQRSLPIAAGLFLLLTIVFYAPLILGLQTFPDGDFTHHFLPFSEYLAAAWRSLSLPLWNPYTYAGHPFLADVQAAVFYPLSSIVLILTLPLQSAGARFYILEMEAVLHVFLAGCFVFVLVRELTSRFWASMLAGFTFMFSGYVMGYPPLQLAVLRTAVWLPLVLWLFLRAWQQPRMWRYWIGAAIALAVAFFAGHSQTYLLLAYATIGWIATLALGLQPQDDGHAKHAVRSRVVGLTACAVVTTGLIAVQLLPSIEFARLSTRSGADYAFVSGGFPVQDTWQVLLPGVLTHFSPLYVGVVSLGLAVFGAGIGMAAKRIHGQRTPQARVLSVFLPYGAGYFIALALFGLLASYGGNGFLYPMLYKFAPGWDLFRGQERAAYLVAFAFSVLAGYGLAIAPNVPAIFRRRYALMFGTGVTALVYVFGLLWQLPGRSVVDQWHYLGIATITLVLAMSLAVTLWVDGWSERRGKLICLLAVANLFWANAATNLQDRTLQQAVQLSPEAHAVRAAIDARDTSAAELGPRVYNEFRVFEDYGMRVGVEDVWGSSPLRLSTYAALFNEFPLDRMFRLTGVDYVLTWRKELFEPSELIGEFPQQNDSTYLHRLLEPNPRIWMVDQLVSADDERAIAMLSDHTVDLDAIAIMPSEFQLADWSGEVHDSVIHATRRAANRLHIDVADSGGGILLVSENWMPGWRVEEVECSIATTCEASILHASGMPLLTPLRADLTVMAIALPEGDVRFDLVYAPNSYAVGAALSLATMLALALALGIRMRVSIRGNDA